MDNIKYSKEDMVIMRKEAFITGYKQAYKDAFVFIITTAIVVGIAWIYCKLTIGY